MTVRLRPHHLLCLLTYAGKGYSPAFIANYDAIAARIGQGEDVVMVEGPDDICAPLLDDAEAHCLRDSVIVRDAQAAEAVAALIGQAVEPGVSLSLAGHLPRMREAFAAGTTRAACHGCEWFGLCSDIAASGFDGARISPR